MTSWLPGADSPEGVVRLTHVERCAILLSAAPPAGTNIVVPGGLLVTTDEAHLTESGLLEVNVAIIVGEADVTPEGLNPLQFYNPPTETFDAEGNVVADAASAFAQMLSDAVAGRF